MPALCRKAKIPYLGTLPIHDCINAAKEPSHVNTSDASHSSKQLQVSRTSGYSLAWGPRGPNPQSLSRGCIRAFGINKNRPNNDSAKSIIRFDSACLGRMVDLFQEWSTQGYQSIWHGFRLGSHNHLGSVHYGYHVTGTLLLPWITTASMDDRNWRFDWIILDRIRVQIHIRLPFLHPLKSEIPSTTLLRLILANYGWCLRQAIPVDDVRSEAQHEERENGDAISNNRSIPRTKAFPRQH